MDRFGLVVGDGEESLLVSRSWEALYLSIMYGVATNFSPSSPAPRSSGNGAVIAVVRIVCSSRKAELEVSACFYIEELH